MVSRRAFLAASAAAFAARCPNILVFMSDQESALLPGPASLPNRDRLLKRGLEFTNAFCNTPQCSPARAALLTGLDPNRAGVLTNVDGGSLGRTLNPALPNIGRVFQDAGYRTAYFGKWHLGHDSGGLAEFGFAESPSLRGDDDIVREAAKWLSSVRAPWLAWVSVLNPHNIYAAPRLLARIQPRAGVKPPASDVSNLHGKPAEQMTFMEKDQGRPTLKWSPGDWVRYRSHYLELVEKVDQQLGTVLDAVKNWGDTAAVYTSDHGDGLGEHGLPFKGPFMYEPLIRIPYIIAAPGMSRGRQAGLVTQADLAPTLAGLAGIGWPRPITGSDRLKPPLKRDAVFLEYYAKQKWVNPIRTIRTEQWKLNWYDSGHKELYDLRHDPDEKMNLAGAARTGSIQSELERRLDAWRKPLS